MTVRGENIMHMSPRERQSFVQQNIARPASTEWGPVLGSRERVFLSLCATLGSPLVALERMQEMAGVDPVSGEEFALGEWEKVQLHGDEPTRLYAGLLMDPRCEAYHRLALQAHINGVGATKAVHAVIDVLGDKGAKSTARVAAARVMADMASMLSKVGLEQLEIMRGRRDQASGVNALPSPETVAEAEEMLRRLRALETEAKAALAPPSTPTAEDLMS